MSKATKTTTTATIADNKTELIQVIKALKPRETISKKDYPTYYKWISEILTTVYAVYRAREKGTSTKESESEAMAKITSFLHSLGKANGKYISVCEKTTENGVTSVFFDTLVYHSFKDRIYTKSIALADLELEKAEASKAKAKAHKALLEDKGTAKAYKSACEAYDAIIEKIEAERKKDNSEGEMVTMESVSKFAKFVTARLKAIINKRYALTKEEAEALRKIRNKEAKAKRSKTEAEPKTEPKKSRSRSKAEPKAEAEAEKKIA